jgi:hypothetical protein
MHPNVGTMSATLPICRLPMPLDKANQSTSGFGNGRLKEESESDTDVALFRLPTVLLKMMQSDRERG